MTVVAVVGDVMDDVLVRAHGPVTPGSDNDSEIRRVPGGSGANQAAWLASLGISVRFYGRVGAADAARHAAALGRLGVDARLSADDEAPTGTIAVLVDPAGERTMYTDRGANRGLAADDLPPSLDGVTHLHVSGYALFEPGPAAAVAALIGDATRRSITVSVDPSSVTYLRAVGPDTFLDRTSGCTIVFPNAAEARLLSCTGDDRAAASALTARYPLAVVTRGRDGAVVAARGALPVEVPAVPAEVVDTTGAGDAFCAGFLAAHLAGATPETAGRAGVETAATALSRMGARPPMP